MKLKHNITNCSQIKSPYEISYILKVSEKKWNQYILGCISRLVFTGIINFLLSQPSIIVKLGMNPSVWSRWLGNNSRKSSTRPQVQNLIVFSEITCLIQQKKEDNCGVAFSSGPRLLPATLNFVQVPAGVFERLFHKCGRVSLTQSHGSCVIYTLS